VRVIWEMQIVGLVSEVLRNRLRISVATLFPRRFIFKIVISVTAFTPMEFPPPLLPQVSAPFFKNEKKTIFFLVICSIDLD